VLGAVVTAIFLLPFARDGIIYPLALFLLLGGAVLWTLDRLVARRTPARG
jgi:APA family basic amino acid/polyamine antiporter